MPDQIINTSPPSKRDSLLKDKFAENIANQSTLMDDLAKQLITLELALPGIYAIVLKLLSGDKSTLVVNYWLYIAFACWLVALLLTLFSLFPRPWHVNRNIMRQDTSVDTDILGIEDFFEKSATSKRHLNMTACILFFTGIMAAVFNVI